MLRRTQFQSIELSANLVEQLRDGFVDSSCGEDMFDAVVGLLGMLAVLGGQRPAATRRSRLATGSRCRRLEFWAAVCRSYSRRRRLLDATLPAMKDGLAMRPIPVLVLGSLIGLGCSGRVATDQATGGAAENVGEPNGVAESGGQANIGGACQTGGKAGTPEGGTDAGLVSCDDVAPTETGTCCTVTECASDEPTATISGTTPLGAVNFSHGAVGGTAGMSESRWIEFAAEATPVTYSSSVAYCGSGDLRVDFPGIFFSPSTVGPQVVTVTIHLAEGAGAVNLASTQGTANLTTTDAGMSGGLSGTLDIVSPGWDVHGSFAAPACSAFFFNDK